MPRDGKAERGGIYEGTGDWAVLKHTFLLIDWREVAMP